MPEVTEDRVKALADTFAIPATVFLRIDAFGIGDVRTLTEKSFMRPSEGDAQLIVVSLTTITVESQQALLKLLEEPPCSTMFVFCVPSSLFLLPTLLSRFSTLALETEIDEVVDTSELDELLALPIGERVETITKRLAAKDVLWVTVLKRQLIAKLANKSFHSNPDSLPLLYWIADHLQTRGASNKQLLEELALTLR
jgi:DNA polymerase III delta prime subunit